MAAEEASGCSVTAVVMVPDSPRPKRELCGVQYNILGREPCHFSGFRNHGMPLFATVKRRGLAHIEDKELYKLRTADSPSPSPSTSTIMMSSLSQQELCPEHVAYVDHVDGARDRQLMQWQRSVKHVVARYGDQVEFKNSSGAPQNGERKY
jgi:hypothetical protein